MKRPKNNLKGYCLIELISILVILLVLVGISLPIISYLTTQYRKMEVDKLQRTLIHDISNIQIESYYCSHGTWCINFTGNGYVITHGLKIIKKVDFEKLGIRSAVITTPAQTIEFLPGGTPKSMCRIEIFSKTKTVPRRIIEVQPITGRIIVKELDLF